MPKNISDAISGFFTAIQKTIDKMLDYLNPTSDNFFLKTAFIPEDGWFSSQITSLHDTALLKFGWVSDLRSMLSSITMNDTDGIENIHAVIPIINRDVTVVDFTYINQHASFIRGLCSAFIYFLMIIYILRNAPSVWGQMT